MPLEKGNAIVGRITNGRSWIQGLSNVTIFTQNIWGRMCPFNAIPLRDYEIVSVSKILSFKTGLLTF